MLTLYYLSSPIFKCMIKQFYSLKSYFEIFLVYLHMILDPFCLHKYMGQFLQKCVWSDFKSIFLKKTDFSLCLIVYSNLTSNPLIRCFLQEDFLLNPFVAQGPTVITMSLNGRVNLLSEIFKITHFLCPRIREVGVKIFSDLTKIWSRLVN